VLRLEIPGSPLPKQRPRFAGKRVYSPSKAEERRVRNHVTFQLPLHYKPLKGTVRVTADFYRKDKRRVDLDNLVKLVADALNGLVFDDDSQIRHWVANMHVDKENPRTVLTIEEVEA
jgi:crossover junction endodeoxyribonuclease RusA